MSNLRNFTDTIAAALTQGKVSVRRMLTGLYLRGSKNPNDYSELAYTGDLPSRLPQAYNSDLDLIGEQFDVKRLYRESDEAYRQRIIFQIRRDTTNRGLRETIRYIMEGSPYFHKPSGYSVKYEVDILENNSHYFDGISNGLNVPVRGMETQFYGVVIYIKPKALKDKYGRLIRPLFSGNYLDIIKASESESFRELMSMVTAAGVRVDRVIFEQPGAGGNRGEIHVYKED